MASTVGKIIKCRAAIAWEIKKPLVIEEIEVEPPKEHEVRVQLISTGLCHSDKSLLNGTLNFSNIFPIILGHEGAGIVESVGPNVTKFKPGDHVILLYAGQCFECEYCKSSKTNLCQIGGKMQVTCRMLDGTTRFKCRGKPIHHFVATSTFCEYTVVGDMCLTKINDKAPLEKMCLLGCGISTGYGAPLNSAKVEPGSTCAVWGLGGVGLAAIMGCRKAGAAKIYGIDVNPEKFEIAKKFGCTDFINPNDYNDDEGDGKTFTQALMKMTNGGFDYTFECVGYVKTTRMAIDASHPAWGKTTIVGIASFDDDLKVFPFDIICGRSIHGTFFGGWKSVESIPKLVDEYLNGEIFIDEFITQTLKLEEINEGFDIMGKGKNIRSVVIF